MTDIQVNYISGFPKEDFEDLKQLSFKVTIPEDKPIVTALAGKPEDYILIFGICFSLKVLEKMIDNSADELAKKISKTVRKIWTKNKSIKPALFKSGEDPIYKQPKAVITFQIAKDETSKIEITNDLDEKQLEKSMSTYLKLVELQYKNRKEEAKLKRKIK